MKLPAAPVGSVWGGTSGPSASMKDGRLTYTTIRKLNTFMAKITENKANFFRSWYNKRMDEARFLRAYFYSELFVKLGGLVIRYRTAGQEFND